MQTKLQLYQEVSEQASKRLWSDTGYYIVSKITIHFILEFESLVIRNCQSDPVCISNGKPQALR